jgi:hypothetical protein
MQDDSSLCLSFLVQNLGITLKAGEWNKYYMTLHFIAVFLSFG